MMKITEFISFWLKNSRAFALGQSLWAGVLACCVACTYPQFNLFYAVLAVVGVMLAHLSANLLDDYFDYVTGDVKNRDTIQDGARDDKCIAIKSGQATAKQFFICAAVFGLIALAIGYYLFLKRGLPVLVLALAGAILSYFYSAPPLKLSFNGLGDIVIGLMFGPLLMNGVFYCAAGTLSLQLLLLSFAIGALVTNIVYVHSIMDVELDLKCGKKTLAGILPGSKFRFVVFLLFALYPYWIVTVGVCRYHMPKLAAAVFLTLYMTVILIKFMWENITGSEKKHTPKFWLGPMENWDIIEKNGVDWFYIRWLLARNITVFFCIILCVVYIMSKFNLA